MSIRNLNKANAVRLDRAQMRRDIAAGKLDPVEVLLVRDDGVPVTYVLESIHRVGKSNAVKLLRFAGLPENLALGQPRKEDLRMATARERQQIADVIASGRRQVQKVAA